VAKDAIREIQGGRERGRERGGERMRGGERERWGGGDFKVFNLLIV
jgi:hypothetical protein